MKTSNFEVRELWLVECPECNYEQDAEFNHDNPMQPKIVRCSDCGEQFILTYER